MVPRLAGYLRLGSPETEPGAIPQAQRAFTEALLPVGINEGVRAIGVKNTSTLQRQDPKGPWDSSSCKPRVQTFHFILL